MAKIYLRHILAGNITLEDVPTRWREKVRELLAKSGLEGLAVEE